MVPDGPDHPSVPALRRGEAWVRDFGGFVAGRVVLFAMGGGRRAGARRG
jgi:hypothetical protein